MNRRCLWLLLLCAGCDHLWDGFLQAPDSTCAAELQPSCVAQTINLAVKTVPQKDLDILFMVDNSPSMSPKQRALARVLPQFIDPGGSVLGQSLLLGAVFLVIGTAWLTVYGFSVTKLRDVLMSARVRRWLERVTGVALLGFSAKLLLDAR